MVAYHDDEWGVPCHDDVELFERLALESFQAGPVVVDDPAQARGVPRGVPRLRSAGRGGLRPGDRERLMADAGIVRNGAKIDATIGNAAAFLAIGAEFGSFDAYLAAMRAAAAGPAAGRRRRGRDPGRRRRCRMRCQRTSSGAGSGSSARRSSTRSCRASGWSTTTSRSAFAIRDRPVRDRGGRTTTLRRRGPVPSRRSTRSRTGVAAGSWHRTGWRWRDCLLDRPPPAQRVMARDRR